MSAGDTTWCAGVSGQLIAVASIAPRVAELRSDAAVERTHRLLQEARRASRSLGPASAVRGVAETAVEPVARALGYTPDGPPVANRRGAADRRGVKDAVAPAGLVIEMKAGDHLVPWVVTAWDARLDPLWRAAVIGARTLRSRWALLCNGTHLRILDASSSHARRWIDFDLDLAADDSATCAALWLIGRADTLPSGLAWLVDASDAFATGLCRSLREGVLTASAEVLGAVAGRRPPADLPQALEQALTVVYRVLFLLFAESRGLVPMWHPVYRSSYSIDALRAAAERGHVDGLWDALRAISHLAHAGCRTGYLDVTPFNGRLFDARRVPFVDRRDLDDHAAGRALLALTTRPSRERGGREPIAYRDLGVEQLGAVYERLLDYQPHWQPPATAEVAPARERSRGRLTLRPGSGVRKATGSFYTPEAIARYVVRQTLGPLVRERSPEAILALRVLDPAMGSGAFLVAACAFLAEAYEQALLATGSCLPHDLGVGERTRIRRLMAERCLFGIDVNPMAVQLGRLSLWLFTLARDRPLSFLDHHVRTGDSLVGVWLSSLRQAPRRACRRRGAEGPRLFETGAFEATARALLPERFALAGPGDTVAQVRRKEQTLARLERHDSPLNRWRQVADLWCAAWFAADEAAAPASAYRALMDAILHGRGALPPQVAERHVARAAAVAEGRHFFHWEIEFPEVFFDDEGHRHPSAGFDAVIGNPPWDMVRGDAGPAEDRERTRAEGMRLVRFARDAGVYERSGHGHVNRYQLFIERSIALLRSGGRCGLVLPGGLLTDHGSAPIRRLLFSRCEVDGVVAFDNRRAVFPIHRSVRFALLTATKGSSTHRFGVRFGETDPAVLDRDDSGARDWFPVELSHDLLLRVSGAGLSVPDVRTALDVSILERVAAQFPPLGSAAGWHVSFGRELNATDDRGVLRRPGDGWPVVEGKQLVPFEVRVALAPHAIRPADATRRLPRVGRVRLAYRDVASATNRQTLIAALLPAECASTHTVFCLKTPLVLLAQHYLCGLFNSYLVNYLVRFRVATHVTTAIVEGLPVPTFAGDPVACRRIAMMARRLARLGDRSRGDRSRLLARLNAGVAGLYGLTVDEYAYVLDTFPLVPAEDRTCALDAYRGKPVNGTRAGSLG